MYASQELLREAQRTIRQAVRRPLLSGYGALALDARRGFSPSQKILLPPPSCMLLESMPALAIHGDAWCPSFRALLSSLSLGRRCRALTSARPLRSRPRAAFRC